MITSMWQFSILKLEVEKDRGEEGSNFLLGGHNHDQNNSVTPSAFKDIGNTFTLIHNLTPIMSSPPSYRPRERLMQIKMVNAIYLACTFVFFSPFPRAPTAKQNDNHMSIHLIFYLPNKTRTDKAFYFLYYIHPIYPYPIIQSSIYFLFDLFPHVHFSHHEMLVLI